MKKKECEAIGRKLLPQLPGFVVKGKLLLLQPLGHTIRGVYFAGSSDPRNFYVEIFLMPLFIPSDTITFSIGWRLRHGGGEGWKAEMPDLIAELSKGLKREAIPFLSRIQSPHDLANVAGTVHPTQGPILHPPDPYISDNHVVQEVIAFALSRAGDIVHAIPALDRFISCLKIPDFPPTRARIDRTLALKSLLLSDPAAAQQQLDAWEAETVRNVGLEEFWCGNSSMKGNSL